ncbi:hypothetical protein N7448_001592 [Penicillium atrosanguineum]|nr:hypothetical protein N7448_001592 [Penicillium atrosanguineum]
MESPRSDDGGERPVRKQLSKATIDSTPQDSTQENTSGRKRSFEESRDAAEYHTEDGQIRKKRSREGTPNSPEQKQAGSKDESAGPQEKSPGPHQADDLPECDGYPWTKVLEEREMLSGRLWHEVLHHGKLLRYYENCYGEYVDGFNASKHALKLQEKIMDKREQSAAQREEMAMCREKAAAIHEKFVQNREKKVQRREHEPLNETVTVNFAGTPHPNTGRLLPARTILNLKATGTGSLNMNMKKKSLTNMVNDKIS